MSEYGSVVERARKAFGSVARLEEALARDPTRRDLQINLAAFQKLARQSQEQLLRISESAHIEVCNYRLLPEAAKNYAVFNVTGSLSAYQGLFSQIYDSLRNGPKTRATFGKEAADESTLEFAYSYSGSLGIVLVIPNDRDLISARLDPAIDGIFRVIEIDNRQAVREIAKEMGGAVVKRVHDWSKVNVKAGFAADVTWNKSDGKQLGEVIERRKMEKIVEIIGATSDETVDYVDAIGMLMGGHIGNRTFNIVVPNGPSYRGELADEFPAHTVMTLGNVYQAKMKEKKTVVYATDKEEITYELLSLFPANQDGRTGWTGPIRHS